MNFSLPSVPSPIPSQHSPTTDEHLQPLPVIADCLSYAHFEQMEALELQYYSADYITPAQEAYRWYQKHSYTTTAALVNNNVIGFVNLFPISESCFEQLLQGTLNDHDLNAENVVDIATDETPLHMFLSCILIEPPYRRTLTPHLLQAAIAPYIPHLHRCKLVATDNITPKGADFSRRYGFCFKKSSRHGSLIFTQPFVQFCQRIYASLSHASVISSAQEKH